MRRSKFSLNKYLRKGFEFARLLSEMKVSQKMDFTVKDVFITCTYLYNSQQVLHYMS